jgi:hypothetical protein
MGSDPQGLTPCLRAYNTRHPDVTSETPADGSIYPE